MAFWAVAITLLAVMTAALDVVLTARLFDSDETARLLWYAMTPAMMGLTAAFWWFGARASNARGAGQIGFGWLGHVGRALIAVLMVIVAMLHVASYHETHTPILDAQAIRVTATVTVTDISDSRFDVIDAIPYRQKARIDDIRAIQTAIPKSNNPFFDPAIHTQANNQSDAILALPKSLTVMIHASATQKLPAAHEFSVLNDLSPNTKMTMDLEITGLRPSTDNVGFDSYRWLVGRGVHANARVLAVHKDSLAVQDGWSLVGLINQLRHAIRQHFLQGWTQKSASRRQAEAVTLSLLTGDRALITKPTKELYQFAGISHLLAISGTHVMFLAIVAAFLLTKLFDRLTVPYRWLSRWQWRWLVMSLTALVYALFTGFDVPAMRTVYMLIVAGVARYLLFGKSPFWILMAVALMMAWHDPYVLWQAGFWLSFVAVALLIAYESDGGAKGVRARLGALIKLQVWLFLALMPLSVLIFGKVSLFGFASNLFVVALFGWLIVPLNLLAVLVYFVLPSIADVLWSLVVAVLGGLHMVFELVQVTYATPWLTLPISVGVVLLAALCVVPFLIKSVPKYALLPMALMLIIGLVHAKLDGTDKVLQIANSQQAKILLIKETHSWLVLENHHLRTNVTVLHDEVMRALAQQGVTSLQGIIVQNDDEAMRELVAQLSLAMVVHDYWQAGGALERRGRVTPRACQTGQAWQGDSLSVEAVTGWRQIADRQVQSCALLVRHKGGLMFELDHLATDRSYDSLDKQANNRDNQAIHSLIINPKNHDTAWQMWQILCQSPSTELMRSQQVDAWLGDRSVVASENLGSPNEPPTIQVTNMYQVP